MDELDGDWVVEELPYASLLEGDDQAALLEDAEVVHHGDARGVELRRELADAAPGAQAEDVEDATSRRVAEGIEDLGHVVESGSGGCHM